MVKTTIQFDASNKHEVQEVIYALQLLLGEEKVTVVEKKIDPIVVPKIADLPKLHDVEDAPVVEKKKRAGWGTLSDEQRKKYHKDAAHKWFIDNKEKKREYMRKYYLAHPEKFNKKRVKKTFVKNNAPIVPGVSPLAERDGIDGHVLPEWSKKIEFAICPNPNCLLPNADHKFVKGSGFLYYGKEYHNRRCYESMIGEKHATR